MMFGLACCAIEMICTAASRYDFSRFGMEVMRPSAAPGRPDDRLGYGDEEDGAPIVRLYNQMPEPKYVLSMGACATGGGPFKEGYNVVSGIDKYVPVDVYVPGCPPTPQALLHGSDQPCRRRSTANRSERCRGIARATARPIPVPILGPDIDRSAPVAP